MPKGTHLFIADGGDRGKGLALLMVDDRDDALKFECGIVRRCGRSKNILEASQSEETTLAAWCCDDLRRAPLVALGAESWCLDEYKACKLINVCLSKLINVSFIDTEPVEFNSLTIP